MKKLSHIINDEKAFYFPLVLMITIIVLSTIATTVVIYRNELVMTQHVIDQVKAETIIQMSRNQFLANEVYKEQERGEVIYEFPAGTATMRYEQITDDKYTTNLTIMTNEQFLLETVMHLMIEFK